MYHLVMFLIVWAWITSSLLSFGLFVGYFDGVSNEINIPFDCLEEGALFAVGTHLFGGPFALLPTLWMTRLGRYGLVWRWKKNA